MSKHHIDQHLADYYAYEDAIEAATNKYSQISKNQSSASESVQDDNREILSQHSNIEEDECCSARLPYEDENGDLTIEARLKIWGGIAIAGLALSNPILGIAAGYGIAKWQGKHKNR